jgi:multiple sugar transport system permease protein
MTLIALPASEDAPARPATVARPQPASAPRRPIAAQPSAASVGDRGHSKAGAIVANVMLAALGLFTVLPIAWMYLTSFRPPNALFSGLLATHFSLENYGAALAFLPFWHLLLNTVLMALGVSLGQLLTGLLAAYAFSRWRFRGERLLLVAIVATWLVPFQLTMLPNYVLLARLGLLNSVAGVIVPQLSSAFAVLLLRQHLKGFPRELLDAARVDGRSSWATLWTVVVPNLAPTLAALEILLFVGAWNEYFWPLIVFHVPDSVLQIGIGNFLNTNDTSYGALMAAGGLATLPLLALYVFLQRRVVNVFVRSGLR